MAKKSLDDSMLNDVNGGLSVNYLSQATDMAANQLTNMSANQMTNMATDQVTDMAANQMTNMATNQATDMLEQATDMAANQATNMATNVLQQRGNLRQNFFKQKTNIFKKKNH